MGSPDSLPTVLWYTADPVFMPVLLEAERMFFSFGIFKKITNLFAHFTEQQYLLKLEIWELLFPLLRNLYTQPVLKNFSWWLSNSSLSFQPPHHNSIASPVFSKLGCVSSQYLTHCTQEYYYYSTVIISLVVYLSPLFEPLRLCHSFLQSQVLASDCYIMCAQPVSV